MAKYKLQIAIAFVGFLGLFGLFFTFQIANENHWFESSKRIYTILKEGDGLRRGTQVSLRGVRVGAVEEIDILDDGSIKLNLSVKSSFFNKLRSDTSAQVKRSLLISDKKIDLLPGISTSLLRENEIIPGSDSRELTDLLSSGRLWPFMEKFEMMAGEFMKLAQKFGENERIVKIVEIYDQLLPMIRAMRKSMESGFPNMVSDISAFKQEFVDKGSIQSSLSQVNALLDKINQVIQKEDVQNITQELRTTLRETAVTMRAMQEMWLLETNALKARKQLFDEPGRLPASKEMRTPKSDPEEKTPAKENLPIKDETPSNKKIGPQDF